MAKNIRDRMRALDYRELRFGGPGFLKRNDAFSSDFLEGIYDQIVWTGYSGLDASPARLRGTHREVADLSWMLILYG